MAKVADFGTSRYLEIAAHGTTVIGSPPYMAPEQFHGKAVFASDIYSLGVTMYQMLTGSLPYDTPAPADIGKLMSGELVSNPRLLNPSIPRAISEIVLRAMAPEVTDRYQRASDLLDDCSGRDVAGSETISTACDTCRQRRSVARATRGRRQPSEPAPSARITSGALLLAMPQAAARPQRSLPVL